jgi:hypothetical protein
VLLTAAMALYWATTPTRILLSQAGIASNPETELSLPVRTLAFAISMIPLGAPHFINFWGAVSR